MDINWLINRVKNILLTPKTEWPVVGAEQRTDRETYIYVIALASVAALASFVKSSIIGYSVLGITARTGVVSGLVIAVISVALAALLVFLMGLIIDALAPSFGSEKNRAQATRTFAFAWTAAWAGAVLVLVPWLGPVLVWVGVGYAVYLLVIGLPSTLKTPPDKALGFGIISGVLAIVIGLVISLPLGLLTFASGAAGTLSASGLGDGGSSVSIDPDSALGKFEKFGQSMEAATKQLEQAQKSGDVDAQADAAAKMFGSLMGGGVQVEAVSTDALKALVPSTLGGFPRTSLAAEKTGAMGVEVSNVDARYAEGERSLSLQISDAGGAAGLMGLASWANVSSEREDESGYEKTYKAGGNFVSEKWNKRSRQGEYSMIVADRFVVKVEGNNIEMDDLKSAIDELDLDALAEMKHEGVQKG